MIKKNYFYKTIASVTKWKVIICINCCTQIRSCLLNTKVVCINWSYSNVIKSVKWWPYKFDRLLLLGQSSLIQGHYDPLRLGIHIHYNSCKIKQQQCITQTIVLTGHYKEISDYFTVQILVYSSADLWLCPWQQTPPGGSDRGL